jgi:hypothetical protein
VERQRGGKIKGEKERWQKRRRKRKKVTETFL